MLERLTTGPTKTELVHQHLREEILRGGLRSGQRLSMDELARTLGVSKIPVREAIARLQSEGLVSQTRHAGAVVTTVGRHQLRGVFLARRNIEPLAAELAAPRMDDVVFATLTGIQEQLGNELNSARADKWHVLSQLNSEFHVTIARQTGFEVFVDFTQSLLTSVRQYRATAANRGNWESTVVEHGQILAAFEHGTPQDAALAARNHVVSQMAKEVGD